MSLDHFQYGIGAVIAPDQQVTFTSCTQNLIADTRPENFLEQLIVDQLLHAQWELHRINQLTDNIDAEDDLLKASARATRNWSRATRELAALQTARTSRELCALPDEKVHSPLADLTKIPKRRGPVSAEIEADLTRVNAANIRMDMDASWQGQEAA